MKQKILITGASGFVGFHLIEAAISKGLEVYAAIRPTSNVAHLSTHDIKYTYLNFSSVENLEKDLAEKQYDFIIHAAGTTKAANDEEYATINTVYATNLAKAGLTILPVLQKFVFISSLAASGPAADIKNLISELNPPAPVTVYGISKLAAEEQMQALNIPLISLRPTAVYGPRDKDIFILLKTLSKGFEPYIGKQKQQLSFVYAKDLAIVAINALFTTDAANGSYLITDGKCYERYELANIVKRILNIKTIKFHLPLPVVKVIAALLENSFRLFKKVPALNREKLPELTASNWCCDIQKAKHKLSFRPKYDLETGLKETLDWYKKNKWL